MSRSRWIALVAVFVLGGEPAAQPASGSEEASEARRTLDEIVVFAQKRSEATQDVPLAVTAMDGAAIERRQLLTLPQLTEHHPSVSFDTAQSFQRSSLKVRGIGTIGNSRTFEGAVGVFIDGVYRPRSGMVLMDLFDLERLDVLRGPQSTLFGKNTVAGTIVVTSRAPEVGRRETTVELGLGNVDFAFLTGAANVPFGSDAAVRVAGVVHRRDGYFSNPDTGDSYDDVDRYGMRAQYRLLGRSFDLLLAVDLAKSNANCCWGSAQVLNGPTAPLIAAYAHLNDLTYFNAPEAERDRVASLNTLPREKVEDRGLTARIEWDLGRDLTLRSLTSLRSWRHDQIDADPDFVPADLFILNEPAEIDDFSQELNLFMPLRWRATATGDLLVGFHYGREDYSSFHDVRTGTDADGYLNALISSQQGATACLPGVVALDCVFPVEVEALLADGQLSRTLFVQESRSAGVFAHARIPLSERLRLVAGVRWTREEKRGGASVLYWYDSPIARQAMASAGVPDDGTPRNGFDLIGTVYSPSFRADTTDRETTALVSLQYDLSPAVTLYGGVHDGYKAGGVNLFREAVVTDTTIYAPESARSVEAGLKADYLNRRARTNVALFDTDMSNLQINFFTGLEFRTENTGRARTRGIEIENRFLMGEYLSLDFSVTRLEAQFTSIDNPLLAYLVDRDMPRAPDWASVLALQYERPLSGRLTLLASGLASYMGKHFVDADVATEPMSPAYLTTDLQIGLAGRDERWQVLLWCRNCSDETYRTVYFNSTFQPGSHSAYLNAPRRYGLTLRGRF